MGTLESEPTEVLDGMGFELAVTSGEGMVDLTERLDRLCDRVLERGQNTVVVVRVGPSVETDRGWPGNATVQQVSRWERAVRRLSSLPATIIGVAEGTCSGAALHLLLATDLRMCTADLRLLLPVNDGHFWPGMVIHRLVQELGAAPARRIVMWGEDIDAGQAVACGLVDRVAEDLPVAVREATVLMGRIGDAELAIRRQLLVEAYTTDHDEAFGVHLAACDRELRRMAEVEDR